MLKGDLKHWLISQSWLILVDGSGYIDAIAPSGIARRFVFERDGDSEQEEYLRTELLK